MDRPQEKQPQGYHRHSHTHQNRLRRRKTQYPEQLRSEEHTSELQSRLHLVCRLLLEKKKKKKNTKVGITSKYLVLSIRDEVRHRKAECRPAAQLHGDVTRVSSDGERTVTPAASSRGG